MPAIRDLDSAWQRPDRCFAIPATAVARHDLDPRMCSQPGLDSCPLTIGQQRHDPPTFEIADDAAIAMVAAERPVIDADNPEGLSGPL